jgi:hypothetical protein
MSVYNATGSGGVHLDRSISGRKNVAAKKMPPFLKKGAKADPAEDAPKSGKKAAKKAAPKKAGY